MTHPLGVPRGISDCDCAASRTAEQREPLQAGGIDDRLEVAHCFVERARCNIPVRETVATTVVAHEAKASRQCLDTWPEDEAAPIPVQMGHPVRGAHQRPPCTTDCECDPDAIRCRRKSDFLPERLLV